MDADIHVPTTNASGGLAIDHVTERTNITERCGAMPNGDATPESEFIEDVAAFIGSKSADDVISELQEKFRGFKNDEARLLQRRVYNLNKLPKIERTLEIVNALIQKQGTPEAVRSLPECNVKGLPLMQR